MQLLFWGALALAFIMATLPQPPALPFDPGDKALHALAFFVLATLAALAYPRLGLLTIFIGLVLFGAAIEVVQSIPQLGREASLMDWLADIGAAAVALISVGIARRLHRTAQG